MNILAIDSAIHTGWAVGNGKHRESGFVEFAAKRGEDPGMRFVRFRLGVREMIEVYDIDLVIYEQAHYRGGAATELCVGFVTRIIEEAARAGIHYTSVHSGELKKWATNNGRAGKEDMIRRAKELYGFPPKNDDHADALLALAWGRERYG